MIGANVLTVFTVPQQDQPENKQHLSETLAHVQKQICDMNIHNITQLSTDDVC